MIRNILITIWNIWVLICGLHIATLHLHQLNTDNHDFTHWVFIIVGSFAMATSGNKLFNKIFPNK